MISFKYLTNHIFYGEIYIRYQNTLKETHLAMSPQNNFETFAHYPGIKHCIHKRCCKVKLTTYVHIYSEYLYYTEPNGL